MRPRTVAALLGWATALALIPLVIRGNAPGHELEYPMAVVIVGSVLSSTFLNLCVLPVLHLRYGASELSKSP